MMRKREVQIGNSGQDKFWVKLSTLGHDVQRIGTSHCAITCSPPPVSVTYKLSMIGSRVACSSCVVQGAEAFLGRTTE